MWICNKCKRVFKRTNQQHSCKTVSIEQHFRNKELAQDLFYYLFKQINNEIGQCKTISLACCIHLFGNYDFLAILPHKDRLEIRFAYKGNIKSSRVTQSVNLSKNLIKICIDIKNKEDINSELIDWLRISYFLNT